MNRYNFPDFIRGQQTIKTFNKKFFIYKKRVGNTSFSRYFGYRKLVTNYKRNVHSPIPPSVAEWRNFRKQERFRDTKIAERRHQRIEYQSMMNKQAFFSEKAFSYLHQKLAKSSK